MRITSQSFAHGEPIPEKFAFAKADPETHATLSDNRNPELSWDGAPEETRSLVLLCTDSEAPTVGDDVNKEGRAVPADLPRADFQHWVMVDIPPSCSGVADAECSSSVTAGGKNDPAGPAGSRQGVNDYTSWFAGDDEMGGTYLGYDGPAPPWNDERVHRYHFRICAVDLDRCPVGGEFTVADVLKAIEGHILDEATLTGTYTTNPDV